ncbi:hypothetical protein ACLBWT_14230 [Paenibacillus sp. D51F]
MKDDGNANEHELLDRTLLTEGDFVAVTREDGCRIGPCSANAEELLGIAAGKAARNAFGRCRLC